MSLKEVISSSPEMSSTAQLAQGRTETLYGVKYQMNLRLESLLTYWNIFILVGSGEFGPFTIRPSGIFGEFGPLVGEFGPLLENSAN